MKRAVAITALVASLAACALHVQVGVSMRSKKTGEWLDDTAEFGGSRLINSNAVTGVTAITVPVGTAELYFSRRTDGLVGVRAQDSFSIRLQHFAPAEAVVIDGELGYDNVYQSYGNALYDHVVVTMRGDPYSIILNDTGTEQTINDVLIPNGESARLLFPVYLVMPELQNAKFYDLTTGEEITPFNTGNIGEPASYANGAYCMNWGGDIRISCDRQPSTPTNTENIIYGDMLDENMGEILHGKDGSPIYGPAYIFSFMTWWDFNQQEWGNGPSAKINDEVVCSSHSTLHIIDYVVNSKDMLTYDRKADKATFTFTMSQTPESGKSGGGCTFKCWDSAEGNTQADYENCPAAHKASVYGYPGTVATFKVTVTLSTGEWKVEPVE